MKKKNLIKWCLIKFNQNINVANLRIIKNKLIAANFATLQAMSNKKKKTRRKKKQS